ncbi:unnamed protein product [Brachionus calyciflorus]|uniref:Uncharacterized protein n=1 Tax=Brachionus calyciflorus TaxID=104777 RepID=A0A814D2N1_9BILA|nr:unnamed protein product [Brachionus calyciflorus]
MNKLRSEILEYHSNLINEIDIKSEKAICYFKREEFENQINSDRDRLITKIKEVEKIKLNNLKNSDSIYDGVFCFFIPRKYFSFLDLPEPESEEQDDDDDDDEHKFELTAQNEFFKRILHEETKDKFEFHEQIGRLVVNNFNLNKNLVKNLIVRSTLDVFGGCENFEESIKFKIISQLIEAKKNQLIIDLTQIENNQIKKLNLSNGYLNLHEKSLNFIEANLNIKCLNELKLRNRLIDQIPNNFFHQFKYLTKLKLNLENLKGLNEDVFNGLENLEFLKIRNLTFSKSEPNSFRKLVNLKELILDQCTIKNSEFFQSLQQLKKLVFQGCSISNCEMKNLNYLKSLESLKIFDSVFEQIDKADFKGFNCLKLFESDYEPNNLLLNPQLDILSLKFQTLKSLDQFKMLKFLNIRKHCSYENLNFLNELNHLEFLDFHLENKLTYAFKSVNLPSLKFLTLTCVNTPNFNETLKNLQGLELKDPKFIPRDHFVNLVNLDYLALINPAHNMLNTFSTTNFQTVKNLKYFKIDSCDFRVKNPSRQKKIKEALFKLFQEPNNVECDNSLDYEFLIEMRAKVGDEIISEKIYFEKYLQVSECVREFIQNGESYYFNDCFRNTKKRRLNFVQDAESSDDEDDDEDDYCDEDDEEEEHEDHDYECDCYLCNGYGDRYYEYGGYFSDDSDYSDY